MIRDPASLAGLTKVRLYLGEADHRLTWLTQRLDSLTLGPMWGGLTGTRRRGRIKTMKLRFKGAQDHENRKIGDGASESANIRHVGSEGKRQAPYTPISPPSGQEVASLPVDYSNDPPLSFDTFEPPPYDFAHCKTRLEHTGPYFMPDVIAAIRATGGNFLHMSVLLGRRRTSVRDFVYANIEAKDAWDEEQESFTDRVEQVAQELAVKERDPATVRFWLSTKGKDRGYTPKVEHTGEDGKPLLFAVELASDTDAKLDAVKEKQNMERILDEVIKNGLS